MTTIDTRNAEIMPISRSAVSIPVAGSPHFTSFSRLAPNIAGIARKKVNSAAAVLETPSSSAPTMVAPEREVPGNIAAIS